jgi:hypothetical protein
MSITKHGRNRRIVASAVLHRLDCDVAVTKDGRGVRVRLDEDVAIPQQPRVIDGQLESTVGSMAGGLGRGDMQ